MYGGPVESASSSSPAVAGNAKYQVASVHSFQELTASSALASGATSSYSSSQCSSDRPCEATSLTTLGTCGITNDGDIQKVAALPHGLMALKSYNNQYCNKTITITCIETGKVTTATVTDKCMGCNGFSIDLSNAAFLDLDDLAVGRTRATWYFN